MSLFKVVRDKVSRVLTEIALGRGFIPKELADLHAYFRFYGPIEFDYHHEEDGSWVAVSRNFQYGSIVTNGQDIDELERNIRDAILTAFDLPSAYEKEADLRRQGSLENNEGYAFA